MFLYFSAIYNFNHTCYFLKLDIQENTEKNVEQHVGGSEAMMIIATHLRTNEMYVLVYINWLYLIVMYIIPFAVLVVLNYR